MTTLVPLPAITVVSAGEQYGRFRIAPLEEGHAAALANALRRVLLSSIPGAAVTKIKIEGVYHEFSTIPGVREDVPELVLNVKGLRFRCYAERPVWVALVRHGAGPVRASDIDTPSNIEVVNPNHYLCSLDSDDKFRIRRKPRRRATANKARFSAALALAQRVLMRYTTHSETYVRLL